MRDRVLRRIGKAYLYAVPVPSTPSILVILVGHHQSDIQVLLVPCKSHRARVILGAVPCSTLILLEQDQFSPLFKRNLALELQNIPVRRITINRYTDLCRVILHVLFT